MIPGLAPWVKDLALPWLWCRPVTIAAIRPLAWELPYGLKKDKKTKAKQNKTLIQLQNQMKA